jgi:UDP-N-acetylmuramoylalanine--D-glutamate ligase
VKQKDQSAAGRGDVRGLRFSIMGAARSGLAVAGLLVAKGGRVFLSERASRERFQEAAATLERIGVQYEFGGNTKRVLDTDILVLSPGVPSDAPLVNEALAAGIDVLSELEVASWFCRGPMVAVTGTNGKTTTTVLTGRMFYDVRRPTVIAGNIGTAFSQVVERTTPEGVAVLEVSSFQLDHIRWFRPKVAVILNITPDHLDRYDHSFEKYIAAKQRIFENQTDGDVLIYNAGDEVTRSAVEGHVSSGVRLLPFDLSSLLRASGTGFEGAYKEHGVLTITLSGEGHAIIPSTDISLRGEHNLANAMAASLAAMVMGVTPASIRATLKNFKGVEHRLEFVRQLDGVEYVNDSKATNVDSVWYALRSFEKPIIVLMGGRDKGNDYSRLVESVREHVKAIIAIGESSGRVVNAFTGVVPVTESSSMQDAVIAARERAVPGDVVLLSPACASFDWFSDYEHRGRVFKDAVMALSS